MLGFRHQTVFGLCIALFALAAVSVASVALLFLERQDIGALQERITSLRQENSLLRSQLDDYRNGRLSQREATDRSSN